MKAHFPLGRVRIYVNLAVGHYYVERRHRVAFHRQQAGVGFLDGVGQHPVLDPAAIDEKGHIGAVGAAGAGGAGVALDGVAGFGIGGVNFQHRGGRLGAVDRLQRFTGLAVAGGG